MATTLVVRRGKRVSASVLVAVLVVGGSVVTAGSAAAADPAGCSRTPEGAGVRIICTNGVPAGATVLGSEFADVVEIRGTMAGVLDSGAGDDTITITGPNGTNGYPRGTDGGPGSTGTVTGGDGNDTITIQGGQGGHGITDGGRFHLVGSGGIGGSGVGQIGSEPRVDGGAGQDTIQITGGNGGNASTGGQGRDPGGSAGPGVVEGLALGASAGDTIRITGGNGGNGSSNSDGSGPGGRGGYGAGAALPQRVHLASGGSSLFIAGGNGGSGGAYDQGDDGGPAIPLSGVVEGSPGNDAIDLRGGQAGAGVFPGRAGVGIGVLGTLFALAGDDLIRVQNNRGTVDCGPGNDVYFSTVHRGLNLGCETVGHG